jgi:excisionase family DNA binding protein
MSTQSNESKIPPHLRDLIGRVREEVEMLREEVEGLRAELTGRPSLLDREEAAEKLGVSVRTLDTLEAAGEIEAIRPNGEGGRVLYPPQSVELYIERQIARGEGRT